MDSENLHYLHFVASIERWMESGEPVLTLEYLLQACGKWGQCSQINKMLVCFEMIDHFYAWHDNLDLNTRTLFTM
jgi:hypothetical protein